MANPNETPAGDLDFTPNPSPSPDKKGMSSAGKVKVLVALLVIEGILIGAMAAFWPRTPVWYPITQGSGDMCGNAVCPEEPEYQANQTSFIGKVPWNNRTLYSYQCYFLDEIPERIKFYKANLQDLISIWLTFELSSGVNFTWCNVTRITAAWDCDTITWNTSPELAEHLGYLPINQTNYANESNNATIDVTGIAMNLLQAGGGNISFQVAPVGWPVYSWVQTGLDFTFLVRGANLAAVNPANLFVGVAWVVAGWTRKEKLGGGKRA